MCPSSLIKRQVEIRADLMIISVVSFNLGKMTNYKMHLSLTSTLFTLAVVVFICSRRLKQ